MEKSSKLWGGRFTKPTDPLVEQFTSSIGFDWRLARYDVLGSIAHAQMLGRCRIISAAESRKLVSGLKRILRNIESGHWKMDPAAEDVHTQIQSQLSRQVGEVSRKLHTARSRNDQVSLDLRLWCRDAVQEFARDLKNLQRALVRMAQANKDVIIPGYTHLQRAQPVLLAHHLLAFVEMLQRDQQRLSDVLKRINILPLGSGALAGTSLPIDRAFVAKRLGFPKVAANSIDAVSDRDFAVELLGILASIAVHLSRLSEDFILWATEEFGILALDDSVATGSSLMPQKKNPDVLELIRGGTGLIFGHLQGFLTMLKGQPLSYNRDMQWDKRFIFEAAEEAQKALKVLVLFIQRVRVRKDRIRALLSDSLCATDLAEHLVQQGVAFSKAHAIVGSIISFSEKQGIGLGKLSLAQLQRFSPFFSSKILSQINARQSVERKRSFGSTNPRLVSQQLTLWQRHLKR